MGERERERERYLSEILSVIFFIICCLLDFFFNLLFFWGFQYSSWKTKTGGRVCWDENLVLKNESEIVIFLR